MTLLKTYMDESGIHDGAPVVTVAGYISRPKHWRAWTKDWNKAKRPIKIFHADANICASPAKLTAQLKPGKRIGDFRIRRLGK